MNFGLEKCARICIKRGRVQSKMHIGSIFENDIKELDPKKAYKYLGIEENFDIQHKNEKEKLKKEYLRRLRLVLRTDLSAKNKIHATGSLAVPVLRYSFGIVNWYQEELQKLDRKTRKLLTIYGQHHPKADVDRLYVPRKQGGRGLMQLEAAHAVEITKLVEYVDRKEDPLIQVVRTHQHNTDSAVLETARCLKTEVQRETRKMKDGIAEKTNERWHGKRMRGQLPRNLDEKLVDIEQSYRWLKSGDIKGETESTIVAAQDQAINTNYYENKILKEEIESKCRLCKQHEESIDHLTSGCPILAKNEYLMRHDKVCTHLHYSICKALGIETTDKWYKHMPKPVYEEGDVTVLWNQAVHSDREVTANRPDIVIKNKKEKDVAIPADRNVVQNEAENRLKYMSLRIEIQGGSNMTGTQCGLFTHISS